ncbi:hypothetical protein F5Y12DRAFT_717846 [Xylaria sp. FL1777]|nr:hypothetical protein F5Y12DRAFT_717846 [Xylaria sp. FL1777]
MVLEYERLCEIPDVIDPEYLNPADVYSIFPKISRGSAVPAVRSTIRQIQLFRWLRKWRCGEPFDRVFGLYKIVQISDFALAPADYQANGEPEADTGRSASPRSSDTSFKAPRQQESIFIYGKSMSNYPGVRTTLFGLGQTFGGLVVSNAGLHGHRVITRYRLGFPISICRALATHLLRVNDRVPCTTCGMGWPRVFIGSWTCDEITKVAAPFSVLPGTATSAEAVHNEMRAWAYDPDVWGRIDTWRRVTQYDHATASGFDGAVRRAAFGSREVPASLLAQELDICG